MHAGLSEAKTQISILGSRFVTIGRGGTIHVSDPGDTVGFAPGPAVSNCRMASFVPFERAEEDKGPVE